ncbi:preprotein translocase subunit SecY [Candidatus Gracilibacteria bacterium 28_42_T64]|nr:preprotein translocase subunit SecY [Candidatus Gracilibacteria bacterium 28_42_T64]
MILKSIKSVFEVKDIRKKIIATLVLILVYKLLAVIPVPGVDTTGLAVIMEQQKGLSFFSALMGGGLSNFSIILMGLSPYINAVIIIQLVGVIIPKIGDLQKEGEAGQRKITKMTRWLTLPLAFVQSYGMIVLLNTLAGGSIIDISNTSTVLMAMTIITAGTLFLMWLGEVMTEYGIGNGISVIITAGVLSSVPGVIMGHISAGNYPLFVGLLLATLLIIYIIIKFTEGNRRIPIIYTRTGREEKSYFPIRVNQAGMIPIIFAVSLVTFPSILGQILSRSTGETASQIGNTLLTYFDLGNPTWIFIIVYFLLVLGFAFFYVSITFNTDQVAENIQKRGGYIPGIRPGTETAEYLAKVSAHLNLFGGSFLAFIAVLPYIMGKIMGQSIDFIISAAGLIIIVSVILDIVRKVDSEMKMFDYSKFK